MYSSVTIVKPILGITFYPVKYVEQLLNIDLSNATCWPSLPTDMSFLFGTLNSSKAVSWNTSSGSSLRWRWGKLITTVKCQADAVKCDDPILYKSNFYIRTRERSLFLREIKKLSWRNVSFISLIIRRCCLLGCSKIFGKMGTRDF